MAISVTVLRFLKTATKRIDLGDLGKIIVTALAEALAQELRRLIEELKHATKRGFSKTLQKQVEPIIRSQIAQSEIITRLDEQLRTVAEAVEITSARLLIFGIMASLALALSLVSIILLLIR